MLIKNEPSHKVIANAQRELVGDLAPGQSRTVFDTPLNQIVADNRRYGDPPQPPASLGEINAAKERAVRALGLSLPDAYTAFLNRSNGLDYNGTVIYASHSVAIAGYDDRAIQGIVEANLAAREVDTMSRYLIIGENNDALLVLDHTDKRWRQIDAVGFNVIEDYDSCEAMIAQALTAALD